MATHTTTPPSSRLPRFRRAPGRAGPIQLTERDRAVLYDLYHFKFLTTSMLVKRRFNSYTRGRERLKKLFHHGYVDRQFLPSAGPASSEAILSLGPRAIGELAVCYGIEPTDAQRRRRKPGHYFLEHRLLVSKVRIGLSSAATEVGVGLRGWREEAAARMIFEHRHARGLWITERLEPDGMGWLGSRKARFAFCLEADRATMTVARVRGKFERYATAGRLGAVNDLLLASHFRVLVVVPGAKRLLSLKHAAEDVGLRNVWLTTEESFEHDPVRDHVWVRAGFPAQRRLPLFRDEDIYDVVDGPHGREFVLPAAPGETNGHRPLHQETDQRRSA